MKREPARRGTPAGRSGPRVSPQARSALRGEAVSHEPYLGYNRTNYQLMGGGLVTAALGFLLLSRGEISFAPLLIVIGYCVLIPLGLAWTRRTRPAPAAGERPGAGANSSAG